MRLDELKWDRSSELDRPGANFVDRKGQVHCIRDYRAEGAGYAVFEGVAIGQGAPYRKWKELDALTAQCIVVALIEGEIPPEEGTI